ncbi:MAG: sulfur carrier protein ThiS [Acidimicrobiales bacterium]|nr:sulfur carrier protein ThiS [Acidimicrobiales bacterium]
MINVTINGSSSELENGTTVFTVVGEWAVEHRKDSSKISGIAVAKNGDVISKSNWATTEIKSGDTIEILTAASGG